jgi:hypothetical protein
MGSTELAELVDSFVAQHRGPAASELEAFRRTRNDEEAVTQAALAQLPGGKCHPHQYRIPAEP